jgi:hypothetical protein
MTKITITIGSSTFTSDLTSCSIAGARMAANRIIEQAERAGYSMFTDRHASIIAECERQAAPAIEAHERREAEDAALLAAHPGARISYPTTEYPYHASRPATARDIREALANRRGEETSVTVRRYDVGFSAGCRDVVTLA